jgi:hypothetical protein
MARPHTLLVTSSRDVHVHHVFLHNSTDWTFRMCAPGRNDPPSLKFMSSTEPCGL